jgi:hypothetical protein
MSGPPGPPAGPPPPYPGGAPYGQVPPGRKTPIGLIVGIVVAALVVLCCCAGVGAAFMISQFDDASPFPGPASTAPLPTPGRTNANTVRFEVETAGGREITFLTHSDGRGGNQRETSVRSPWSLEVPCCDELNYSVVAVAAGPGATELTCRILVDGKEEVAETGAGTVTCTWLP